MSAGSGPQTSPSLLMRIRDAGDTESWDTFAAVYGPVIRGYCQRRGIQPSDADDIAQEVLASVAKAIRNFEYEPARGRFRSWLATITANKLKTFLAKRAGGDQQLAGSVEQFVAAPEADSEWSELFLNEMFQAACQRVRPHFEQTTWQCFEDTWVRNLAPDDVAKELGVAVRAVYVNKSRVLKRLEQEFLMLSDDFPISEIGEVI